MPDGPGLRLDPPTLRHAIRLLDDRLQAVVAYGAGGCPTCHDAELRSAIATLRRLLDPPQPPAKAAGRPAAGDRERRAGDLLGDDG